MSDFLFKFLCCDATKRSGAILVLLPLIFFSGYSVASKKPPNLVLIVSDNHPSSLVGAYGNPYIRTPAIDTLASNGMKFNNAFATSGVCSPTRATILTGLLPSQTGVHNGLPAQVDVPDWSAIEEFRNLPQTLADLGYNTGLVGKYHLGQPDKAQLGFDYWVTFLSGHTTSFHDVTVIDNDKRYQVKEHITDFWTQRAVDFIAQQSGKKPFFLMLTYNGPYMLPPSVLNEPKNRHAEYYWENTPPIPQEPVHPYLRNWAIKASVSNQKDYITSHDNENEELKQHQSLNSWESIAWGAVESLNNQKAMVNTASEIQMVDDGVGKVVETIKQQGLDNNTIVIFMSDQGALYGQHGLWGNSSWSSPTAVFQENMRIPLIFWYPEIIKAGTESDRMINQFDLFPTLLDFMGYKDKEIANTPGTSFAKVLKGKKIKWEDAIYFDYLTTRVIQTPDWKYTKRFLDLPDELYNLRTDPEERFNLIKAPEYAKVIKRLDKKLTHFFDRYADQKFDVWKGGTGKAVVHYGGENDIYELNFNDWPQPFVEKAKPFRY